MKNIELISAAKAAKIVGVSHSTMYRMIEAGILPGRRFGKIWKVQIEDAQRLAEEGFTY